MQLTEIAKGRKVVLVALSLFSFIVMALSADSINHISTTFFFLPASAGLSLGVAILTLVVVGILVGVKYFREGAFTSMVVTEIVWSFILMVLWLAAGGSASANQVGLGCGIAKVAIIDSSGNVTKNLSVGTGCGEAQAIAAFSFINWIMLLVWFGAVLTAAIAAHRGGNRGIWTRPLGSTEIQAHEPRIITGVIVTEVQPAYQSSPGYFGAEMQELDV